MLICNSYADKIDFNYEEYARQRFQQCWLSHYFLKQNREWFTATSIMSLIVMLAFLVFVKLSPSFYVVITSKGVVYSETIFVNNIDNKCTMSFEQF